MHEVTGPAAAVTADLDALAALPTDDGMPQPVQNSKWADPVVHGRTCREDQDFEPHRRYLEELMLVAGSRTSPQVGELLGWGAVTDMVGGDSGGPSAAQGLLLPEYACAR